MPFPNNDEDLSKILDFNLFPVGDESEDIEHPPIYLPGYERDDVTQFLSSVGSGNISAIIHSKFSVKIRDFYKRELIQKELLISAKLKALGSNPTDYELRGLAEWAVRERTRTARIWRIPTPVVGIGFEARDWMKYGLGGRTYNNIYKYTKEKMNNNNVNDLKINRNIVYSSTRSNPAVNEAAKTGEKFLRRGGGVLLVAGLGLAAYDIWQAPAERRMDVAVRRGAGIAGGIIGAELAAGALTLGAGILLGVTPAGWLIIAVGLVGAIAGAMVVDKVFFPDDYRPVLQNIQQGRLLNPLRLNTVGFDVPDRTALNVVEVVSLTVRPGDTIRTFTHRAYMQAAASVGLDTDGQKAFADRYIATASANWRVGDPSVNGSSIVQDQDLRSMVGKQVNVRLSSVERMELAHSSI
ncbi:hypothetical protein GE253_08855 [Niveispirillum sp. SYP-B3756]|uniref:hypothetical protein n=1 Tax=Niveispirillum sp. SYP-B3756 TaxID=2662178 RepID=UPI001291AE03|nr:hypothetical protein [Niveispirillum sp. SYP-B3756]MQP65458.1 hypothetical protein [Niveispirillum sp. SYP-B3756]